MRYRNLLRLASAAALAAVLAGPAAPTAQAQRSRQPKKSAPDRARDAAQDTRKGDAAAAEQAPIHIMAGQRPAEPARATAAPAPAQNPGPFGPGGFRGRVPPGRSPAPGAVPGGTLFQFVPGVGFLPLGGGVPGTGIDPFGNPAPGTGSVFQGGPGGDYAGGGGFYPGFAPGITSGITTFGGFYPGYFPGYVTSGVPESWVTGRPLGASVNVRYHSPWGAYARAGMSFGSVARQAPARRPQAGTRPRIEARFEPTPADIRVGSPVRNPEERVVTNRLRAVMADGPLVEGEVITVGATGMQVRYEIDGELRTERFDLDRVFFFREGELAAADTAPGLLRKGDRVLVPLPQARPGCPLGGTRQDVAGTRQEGPRRATPPPPPRAPRAPQKPRGR